MLETSSKDGLFPIRYLGLGFFWAWLFLTTLSPSGLFGFASCLGGIPFEPGELLVRTLLLAVVLAVRHRLSTPRGCRALMITGTLCGAATVPVGFAAELFGASVIPAATTIAVILASCADTAMFLLWLSFFGYMRLGDTLSLLIISYGAGSLLYLALVFALDPTALAITAALLPMLSCATFAMSAQLQAKRTGAGLFGEKSSAVPNPSPITKRLGRMEAPVTRMTIALGLLSLGFALVNGLTVALMAQEAHSLGLFACLIEPASIVLLAGVYLAITRIVKKTGVPYILYRAVPITMGLGFALTTLGVLPTLGLGCIALAYNMFEALALNDYCNVVRAEQSSLLGIMALGRLSISAGMACGWALGYGVVPALGGFEPQVVAGVVCLLLVVVCTTLVFTAREVGSLHAMADDRAVAESPEPQADRAQALASYTQQISLSGRESEVFAYLVEGRTTSYIAGKLHVAESTVRAHVHSIYRKAEVSSRMELLDTFVAYCEDAG